MNNIFVTTIKKGVLPMEESKKRKVELERERIINKNQTPEDRELVILAWEAATMTSPTEEIIGYLSNVGIKRTLEILLVMRQSPSPVRNPIGFVKKAITKGWTPTTLPIKKERNIARVNSNRYEQTTESKIPFYNWLEE